MTVLTIVNEIDLAHGRNSFMDVEAIKISNKFLNSRQ